MYTQAGARRCIGVAVPPRPESYAAAGLADPSYTGHDPDTVGDLYDTWFRRYSSRQGRWLSSRNFVNWVQAIQVGVVGHKSKLTRDCHPRPVAE